MCNLTKISKMDISRKRYGRGNFTPTPYPLSQLGGQNTLVGIRLIDLTESSDITSHFLNIAFYKLFYTYFYCLYLCGTKYFVLKTEPCFTFL